MSGASSGCQLSDEELTQGRKPTATQGICWKDKILGKVKFVFKSSGGHNICGNNNNSNNNDNNIRMLTIVTFHDKTRNNSSSLNLGHRLAG